MSKADKLQLLKLLEEKRRRFRYFKINQYYKDEGALRRELYPKHVSFFAAGANYRERLFIAANRVGKTEGVGLYELTLHLTGRYPDWWVGKRFDRPIKAWIAGNTGKTTRDILQHKLLGYPEQGTGMMPAEYIADITRSRGVPDAVELIKIKHLSGECSTATFKSYEQGREGFEGTEVDVVLLDEEPPLSVYSECVIRTMTNNGIIISTFTPLQGLTDTVLLFMPGGSIPDEQTGSRFVVSASWDDVPHLSEQAKAEMWASTPPYQRDARSRGIPQLGAGAIYPIPETDILVSDFDIPDHWPRCYAMDVGWNRTAAIWLAKDPTTQSIYAYSEYYRGEAEPTVHAKGIKSRGEWIPGVIDPAARGRSQRDGSQLIEIYKEEGLNIEMANNAVESGIYMVWQLLSTGQLKVFASLRNFIAEFRIYRRDEKGRIVKENDHLMDTLRYGIVSGLDRAIKKPDVEKKIDMLYYNKGSGSPIGWMG